MPELFITECMEANAIIIEINYNCPLLCPLCVCNLQPAFISEELKLNMSKLIHFHFKQLQGHSWKHGDLKEKDHEENAP